MIAYTNLNRDERKVYDACDDGWYMGGRYKAKFDDHERTFHADTKWLLFDGVAEWFFSHADHHGDSPLLVKCVKPL